MFLRSGVAQYGGIEDNLLIKHIDELLAYLHELEQAGYPYDRVMLRYSIGSDNGPPDATLPDAVAEWNRRHASPRLVIDSNSGFLKGFEERYGDKLPVLRGDFTPYWEDGVASTSLATSVNRRACERIAQAQILWAMRHPDLALHTEFDEAWTHLVMYDEHTWGAWNSISAPDDPFVVQQDEYKQNYAFTGARLTDTLLKRIAPPAPGHGAIDVHNTDSHPRSGLVRLDPTQSSVGDLVRDDTGTPVPSQRLACGELAFIAADVPAFGTRRFTVHSGQAHRRGTALAHGLSLANSLLAVEIDPSSGALKSLRRQGVEGDWVDPSAGTGLNDYLYILGRNPEEGRARVEGPVTVIVENAGPLVATLRIESGAPGCEKLIRRVQLVDGQDHVELVNTTHKLQERRPEGVYFGFPFNLPDATARIDVPWAVVEVEKDQLPGANRNFYCVQRWVDLATADRGVTWVTVDAPLLQFDPIKISPHGWAAHAFRTYLDPGSHIWSWTMNNHWETNYRADQEGEITFRYAIRPYTGGYDQVDAQQFGRDISQPLLAVAADPQTTVNPPLVTLNGSRSVVATTVRPTRDTQAWLIRLFNEGAQPARATLQWHAPVGATWISNPQEDAVSRAPKTLDLRPYEIVTLRVDQAPAR
jgi:alpha-mannosidase